MASGINPMRHFFLVAFAIIISTVGRTDALRCAKRGSPVSVNWGGFGVLRPSYADTVKLIKSSGIGEVKFFVTDPIQVGAFRRSGIRLTLGIENPLLPSFAGDPKVAEDYVLQNLVNRRRLCITGVAVGNELLAQLYNTTIQRSLVPALWNLYKALYKHGLHKRIKLSSPECCGIGNNAYPPSTAYFNNAYLAQPNGMKDYLEFLRVTGSYYSANIYPFFSAQSNPSIPKDFIFFKGSSGFYDNGLYYQNLLDAQLDSVYNALERAGYPDLKVVITETGWPSGGDPIATVASQQLYNSYIVGKTLAGQGSPKHPGFFRSYIFELFDSPLKSAGVEQNWGIFADNGSRKSALNLTAGPTNPTQPPPRWCVAKATATDADLGNSIAYACSEGRINCTVLDSGNACIACAGCSARSVLERKATYVFNAFYQRTWQNDASACNFSGAAEVSLVDPNPAGCTLLKGRPGPKKWCVVKPGADPAVVQGGVDFVCSQNKDCSFISANRAPVGYPALPGPCYNASNFSLAASFVYNLWFQSNNQNPSACVFAPPGGEPTGQIVSVDPSSGACLMSGSSFPNYFAK